MGAYSYSWVGYLAPLLTGLTPSFVGIAERQPPVFPLNRAQLGAAAEIPIARKRVITQTTLQK